MPAQIDNLSRLESIIPKDREARLADLRKLFDKDEDAVFQLAVHGVPADASTAQKGLEHLARTLSVLMRDGFKVDSVANQLYARGRQGGILPLDDGQTDLEFVQRLYAGSGFASKMDSQRKSRECLDFFLEEFDWDASIRSTRLLRVAPEDAHAILCGLPRYQYASLLDCAREVVRTPSAVFQGLRHEGPMRENGIAFCGIPSRRHMNSPNFVDHPTGFVFIVFANHDGCVFDWDWTPADPENPSIPRNVEERFPGGMTTSPIRGELLVGNIRGREPASFQAGSAWYSRQGDCVFWYHSELESYADRYDEYLTAFFDATNLDPNRPAKDACVGFKLKMVSRLFDTVKRWSQPGAGEGIAVEFDADKIEVELRFLMKAWQNEALPTTKELAPGMRLIEQLGESGRKALDGPAKLQIPKRSAEQTQALEPA